jgi:arylsulfatase A-like enzyme
MQVFFPMNSRFGVLPMRFLPLLLSASISFGAVTARAAEPVKYNVLFLMSDDLRPELGCYGHPTVKTPNIDALAKAGVRFERAYVQFPLCNPSRTSLLTGRYPTVTGVLDNLTWFGAAHPDFVSLPKYFKSNGYVTLRSGKIFHGTIDDTDAWTEGSEKRAFEGAVNPNLPKKNNQAQNSDRIIVLEGDGEAHNDFRIADKAIDFLRKNKDKTFFLGCGFNKPHSPPTAPKKYFDMYDVKQVPLPKDFAAVPAAPTGFPKASIPMRNGDLFINREAKEDEAREVIRAYWASLTWMDWNLGRVMAELDKLGLREKTIIVFWGDHGYHLGEKGKWSKHGSLFEIGTRVPLLVIAPGAKGNGKSCPRIVETLDLYPTLVELCGLPAVKGPQGRSLAPLLADPQTKWDRPAYSVSGNNNKLAGVAIQTDRFRYAEYENNGGAMLFDHDADPHEMTNLAADPKFAEVAKELAEKVRKFKEGKAE